MAKLKKNKIIAKAKVFKKKAPKKSQIKKPMKARKVLVIKARKRKPKPKIKIPRQKRKKIIAKKVFSKKIVSHKKTRRHLAAPVTEFPAEALFKAKIKVIGIGGGGGSIVSEIGRSLEKATFVIADTDIRALKKKTGIKYFWFGEELTHGLGTGVNVDLAKQAAESAKEKISTFFRDQDIIIFVASLGGGLGSGATQVFAEAAKEFGGITFGIFTMPFKFEGKNKYRIAQNALKSLRQSLNVSLVIPNEKIFKVIDESTPITDAFSTVNKSLMESLESLIDLIYNPGVINIDFADLRTILRGRGNSAFLNTIEESGKDRIDKICERVFKNPLLQNSGFEAEKILFNIAGSEKLSMFEVEKISSHIANLNPKAKIIFGISKNPKLKNKIKTTILMTGGQVKGEETAKEKEVFNAAVPEKIKTRLRKKVVIAKKEKQIILVETKKVKPTKIKKPTLTQKKPEKKQENKTEKSTSSIPVFEAPAPVRALSFPVLEQGRMEIIQTVSEVSKKAIRRSGLEIKKAEELEERKKMAQEKEWEIPAFLRKVKFRG